MIDEKGLWTRRRSEYWEMAIKYLKLIGNSGFLFTIYLLFVFGSYYYGQFLEWLPETFPATLFFTVVFTWLITRGRVRTFAKPGDLFFLTPREGKMDSYFRSAIFYSWMMETLWIALLMLVLSPLFADRIYPSGSLVFSVIFLLSALKLWNLATGFEEQRIQEKNRYFMHTMLRFGLNAVTVYAIFSLQSILIVIGIAVALLLFYIGYFYRLSKVHSLKWERLVDIEDSTVMTFYRIANSFTDVPALKSKVRKRAWLSPLFRLVSYGQSHVYRYLFSRAFVRSRDYFGIYLRLTLIGLLFLSVVQIDWGRWLLIIVFAYMTALQVETLKNHFATSSMADLYPVSEKVKLKSHQFWMLSLGTVQAVVFGLGLVIFFGVMDGLLGVILTMLVYLYSSRLRLPKTYSL
ncbi:MULTISPECIES: ABC transporter permease [Bacillaceae]|uniref:ABC transporter permease n=1 Tax=Evansella alkalicola TaxID=745819 RepID=A0ABS6JTZ2_9BACI|nr:MULTISPECIES: ABC transporter permease [Bacillaceae]MBU9720717.1 ABC transporter permease [Bacillus alkalicola]